MSRLKEKNFDTVIIGAGAAGLMCASVAASLGKSVCILEHNKEAGRKILISGGGRCNFTNINGNFNDYVSQRKNFHKYVFSNYSANEFVSLIENYNVEYFEKKLGQLFCKTSSKEIVRVLLSECQKNKVQIFYEFKNLKVEKRENGTFVIENNEYQISSDNLVVASGGLSIEKIGASNIGYKIAEQFDHRVTPLRPALVSLNYEGLSELSGISLIAKVKTKKNEILEDILITHKGFSGPAILKISLFLEENSIVKIDFLPGKKCEDLFKNKSLSLNKVLGEDLPKKFIQYFCLKHGIDPKKKLIEIAKKKINSFIQDIHHFHFSPNGTGGFNRAEVTLGGVETSQVDSRTLESKNIAGLYFIGEVLDVTGQLGGHNFQWAWASGYACGNAIR